jgi:hypothetical protein
VLVHENLADMLVLSVVLVHLLPTLLGAGLARARRRRTGGALLASRSSVAAEPSSRRATSLCSSAAASRAPYGAPPPCAPGASPARRSGDSQCDGLARRARPGSLRCGVWWEKEWCEEGPGAVCGVREKVKYEWSDSL